MTKSNKPLAQSSVEVTGRLEWPNKVAWKLLGLKKPTRPLLLFLDREREREREGNIFAGEEQEGMQVQSRQGELRRPTMETPFPRPLPFHGFSFARVFRVISTLFFPSLLRDFSLHGDFRLLVIARIFPLLLPSLVNIRGFPRESLYFHRFYLVHFVEQLMGIPLISETYSLKFIAIYLSPKSTVGACLTEKSISVDLGSCAVDRRIMLSDVR